MCLWEFDIPHTKDNQQVCCISKQKFELVCVILNFTIPERKSSRGVSSSGFVCFYVLMHCALWNTRRSIFIRRRTFQFSDNNIRIQLHTSRFVGTNPSDGTYVHHGRTPYKSLIGLENKTCYYNSAELDSRQKYFFGRPQN